MRVPGTKMVVERWLDASGRTTRIATDSSDHVSLGEWGHRHERLPTQSQPVCGFLQRHGVRVHDGFVHRLIAVSPSVMYWVLVLTSQ